MFEKKLYYTTCINCIFFTQIPNLIFFFQKADVPGYRKDDYRDRAYKREPQEDNGYRGYNSNYPAKRRFQTFLGKSKASHRLLNKMLLIYSLS